MRLHLIAAAAAALALGSASASAATFSMSLAGPAYTGSTPSCGLAQECAVGIPWLGTLTVETDSTADGLYTEGNLGVVTLDSNLFSFDRPADTENNYYSNAFVTLSNGIPVSLDIVFGTSPFEIFAVYGMSASYTLTDLRGGLETVGNARVFEVPEPSAAWLMLAGLGAIGIRFRGASGRPECMPARRIA